MEVYPRALDREAVGERDRCELVGRGGRGKIDEVEERMRWKGKMHKSDESTIHES